MASSKAKAMAKAMARSTVMRRRVRVLAAVVAVLGVIGAACGSDDATESTQEEPPATATVAAEPPATATTPPVEVAATPGEAELAVAAEFFDHMESGDYESLVSLMTPEYRDVSFGIQTAAQFWTFTSRFQPVPDEPTQCEIVDVDVACSWKGTDNLTRVLGYQLQADYLFSFEDGAISDIGYMANDPQTFFAMATWLDEEYPGEPGCTAGSEELNAYYGGAGVLVTDHGEVFGAACADRMVDRGAEFRDSDRFVPPPEG